MSYTLITKNLEQLKNAVLHTQKEINNGKNPIQSLEYLASAIDICMANSVHTLGGDKWHFKNNNSTALLLSMGDLE